MKKPINYNVPLTTSTSKTDGVKRPKQFSDEAGINFTPQEQLLAFKAAKKNPGARCRIKHALQTTKRKAPTTEPSRPISTFQIAMARLEKEKAESWAESERLHAQSNRTEQIYSTYADCAA
jgi:hypothetical protein